MANFTWPATLSAVGCPPWWLYGREWSKGWQVIISVIFAYNRMLGFGILNKILANNHNNSLLKTDLVHLLCEFIGEKPFRSKKGSHGSRQSVHTITIFSAFKKIWEQKTEKYKGYISQISRGKIKIKYTELSLVLKVLINWKIKEYVIPFNLYVIQLEISIDFRTDSSGHSRIFARCYGQ